MTVIEDMVLLPGVERTIKVSYIPDRTIENDTKAGKVNRVTFGIHLDAKEGKRIQKKKVTAFANVCSSILHLPKNVIPLGDCKLGVLLVRKTRTENFNHSERNHSSDKYF